VPALLALTPHDKALIHNPVGKTKSAMFKKT
jgi:hypothetical protein